MKCSVENTLKRLLDGDITLEQASQLLRLADDQLGFATIDHDRAQRCGLPEVIFGGGKTPEQVVTIANSLIDQNSYVLITRLSEAQAAAVDQAHPDANWTSHRQAVLVGPPPAPVGSVIPIVTAGTSDQPVAEEAALTCAAMGQACERIEDIGVAGIHRVARPFGTVAGCGCFNLHCGHGRGIAQRDRGVGRLPGDRGPDQHRLRRIDAGGDRAAGDVASCAAGVTVVNIDNGFGAAVAATRIQRLADGGKK